MNICFNKTWHFQYSFAQMYLLKVGDKTGREELGILIQSNWQIFSKDLLKDQQIWSGPKIQIS